MAMELAGAAAQLGAAGLIGMMWLGERRSAVQRDEDLRGLVDRVQRDGESLAVLMSLIEANTRALAALEAGQARLTAAIERLPVLDGRQDGREERWDGGWADRPAEPPRVRGPG